MLVKSLVPTFIQYSPLKCIWPKFEYKISIKLLKNIINAFLGYALKTS